MLPKLHLKLLAILGRSLRTDPFKPEKFLGVATLELKLTVPSDDKLVEILICDIERHYLLKACRPANVAPSHEVSSLNEDWVTSH